MCAAPVSTGAIPKRPRTGMGMGRKDSGPCPPRGPSAPAGGAKGGAKYDVKRKSTTQIQTKKAPAKKPAAPPEKERMDLPAFSLPRKVVQLSEEEKELVEWRKQNIRRKAPEGENMKKINEVLKSIKGQDITVQEFVGLVSPFTGDNGAILRKVMDSDLAMFRKMAKKVYETMTQDVSDVLANEQVQLMASFKEKHQQYSDRMMRSIDEIYYHIPDFDFERYFRDPEYLNKALPVPEAKIDEEEEEHLRRQEAFHRMEWLRAEGERMQEENKRLQGRLNEVKCMQKAEMAKAAQAEQEAQRRRTQLEAQQDELKDRLEDLNQTLERSVICGESRINQAESSRRKVDKGKKPKTGTVRPKTSKRPPWNASTAQEIDSAAAEGLIGAETSKVAIAQASESLSSQASQAAPRKKKAVKKKKWDFSRPKVPQETSPFHYSPPKTPPPDTCPPW